MYFSKNIKFLRQRKGRTQDDVAVSLNLKRSTLSGYENGVAQPNMDALLAFSTYFRMSIDTLIRTDLSVLSERILVEMELGNDEYIAGKQLRVLATTVDNNDNENIELVPIKAKAGYTNAFFDPEFIESLPTFRLPMLSPEKKYRTFPIAGDSMLPIPDGSWITGEFIDDWNRLKSGTACILITQSEGIVFKIVEKHFKENRSFVLHSLNALYKPYEVMVEDVKEIWRFVHYISEQLPEPLPETQQITGSMAQLHDELERIKKHLKL